MIIHALAGIVSPTGTGDSGVEVLAIGVVLFAIVLLIVSLFSYRKTGLTRMLLIAAAFGLFAIKTLFQHFGVTILGWTAQTEEISALSLDFAILFLFFVALTIRK